MSWKENKEHAAAEKEVVSADKAKAPKEVEVWTVKVEMDGGHQMHGTPFNSKQDAEAFARKVFIDGFTVETPSAMHIYPPARIGSVTMEKKASAL
jgi:hypothetical protein